MTRVTTRDVDQDMDGKSPNEWSFLPAQQFSQSLSLRRRTPQSQPVETHAGSALQAFFRAWGGFRRERAGWDVGKFGKEAQGYGRAGVATVVGGGSRKGGIGSSSRRDQQERERENSVTTFMAWLGLAWLRSEGS